MQQLSPKASSPESTPNAPKSITKRLAEPVQYRPNSPKDIAAVRAARKTLRSLRSVLLQRDLPAARAIRALARYRKRRGEVEPQDLEILLAVSTVLQELDGGID